MFGVVYVAISDTRNQGSTFKLGHAGFVGH